MRIVIYIVLLIGFSSLAFGQENGDTIDQNELIEILYADVQKTKRSENGYVRYLNGNVQIRKDSSIFHCDSAMLSDKYLKAWGDVSMIKSDSIRVFADSLSYHISSKQAILYGSVHIQNGDQLLFSDKIYFDDINDIASYRNKAILKLKNQEIKSKKGSYDLNLSLAQFSENVSVKGDQFTLFSDTLHYDTDSSKAIFHGPTTIYQDSSIIYTEKGYYILSEKKGLFYQHAKFQDGEESAIADTIAVNLESKQFELIDNAIYESNQTIAKGNKISYNENSGNVLIEGDAYAKEGEQEMAGDMISYNKKSKTIQTEGRSKVDMNTTQIKGDKIYSEDGKGYAAGAITIIDTVDNIILHGDELRFDNTTEYFKIYDPKNGQALLKIAMQDNDSMYIVSDTMINRQYQSQDKNILIDTISDLSSTTDSFNVLSAFPNVQILSNTFQAQCDSLVYHARDSIITLFDHPIMWTDSSQFVADTMQLHVKDNKIKELHLLSHCLILQTNDNIFFNQISGKFIKIMFEEGKLDSMYVDGNAQTIYYLQDDYKAYIGVNKTESSKIMFSFEDNKVDKINFHTTPNSVLFPMQEADHMGLRLENFDWKYEERPYDKELLHPKLFTIVEE